MSKIAIIIIAIGSLFTVIAAFGLLRFPDLLLRMHAATKAGTIGAAFTLLGSAFYLRSFGHIAELLLTIFFIMLTAPIAAHLLARSAYYNKSKLFKHTHIDELNVKELK